MKVVNFGVLQGLRDLRPEDYKNELKAISALNKRVKSPQFHAAISAQGKTFDKYQLTAIAEQWLTAMGYGKQPYLIVFHKDTSNNHVHVVTTRIDRNGKKINRYFENIRAVQQLNKVMGIDAKYNVAVDIKNALAYRYSTIAQFKMILENQGYILKEENNQLQVMKFGTRLADLPLPIIAERLEKERAESKRIAQVKAILIKYAKIYDSTLTQETIPLPGRYGKPTGAYTSELAKYLKDKHGLVLIFHASENKPPYGYSLIDLSGKAVYKGSEIISLKVLLSIEADVQNPVEKEPPKVLDNPGKETLDYYSALLKAAIYNYPDIKQGLYHQGFELKYNGRDLVLIDYIANTSIRVVDLLGKEAYDSLHQELVQSNEIAEDVQQQRGTIPTINLASDIDDEEKKCLNRHRKKKARTNTR